MCVVCAVAAQIDAVKLIGTLGNPRGIVNDANHRVIYVPNDQLYGVDSFDYIISDCPFQDEHQSEPATLTVSVENVLDPPSFVATVFNASSA